MENIIYRKANNEDARAFFTLRNKVWRDAYKDIYPNEVFENRENCLQKNIDSFADRLADSNSIYYVAILEDKIIGILYCSLKSSCEYFQKDNYADLCCLYIDPDFQGKGIGSRFKSIFETWIKDHGINKYVIGVLKNNYKARKTYQYWGGVLSDYESEFEVAGVIEKEVFYTINLN